MAGDVKIEFRKKKLKQAFQNAEKRCRNMRPAWKSIGEGLVVSFQKNFDAEGRPQKWEPLAESTVQRKLRKFKGTFTQSGRLSAKGKRIKKGNKILTDSSRLRNSITYQEMQNGVKVGTNVIYAATHQFGRDAIPARPFLVILDEDETMMVDEMEEHILEELK